MTIALIQAALVWENPKANRAYFEEKIKGLAPAIDLIVLPEMFTTAFTMNPHAVAETMQGETIIWLKVLAKAKNTAITGSMIIKENGNFYNRMLFVFPSGTIEHYDKRHLFSFAGEDKIYKAGTQKKVVTYLGWKICLLICYDLRFPVFSRNVENYDLLIYVANWPKARILAWNTLLQARAIENLSYVIGVNRTGGDGYENNYIGHSQVINGLGEYVVQPEEAEGVLITAMDRRKLIEIRKKFDFLNDKDAFELKL